MREAATNLDFESAARIRDELFEVKAKAGARKAVEDRCGPARPLSDASTPAPRSSAR